MAKKRVGRPKGSVKPRTVDYHRRVRPELVDILDNVLFKAKEKIKEDYERTLSEIKDIK